MLKKNIKYTDYAGEERSEDFFFNLSKAELMEMNFEAAGGMQQRLEKIVQTKDTVKLAEMFKEIIKRAYGVPSEDGKRFVKYDTVDGSRHYLFEDFEQSEAYSELYMELATDDKAAADFINAVLPKVDRQAEAAN